MKQRRNEVNCLEAANLIFENVARMMAAFLAASSGNRAENEFQQAIK